MKPVWYKKPLKGKERQLAQQRVVAHEVLPSPPEVIDLGEPPADGKYEEGGIPASELGLTPPPDDVSPLFGGLVITGSLTVETPSVQDIEDTAQSTKKPRKKKKESVEG